MMVTEIDGKFKCDECGLFYADLETATKCEEWCSKTNSCNTEIIKKAIKP